MFLKSYFSSTTIKETHYEKLLTAFSPSFPFQIHLSPAFMHVKFQGISRVESTSNAHTIKFILHIVDSLLRCAFFADTTDN